MYRACESMDLDDPDNLRGGGGGLGEASSTGEATL